ncbi:MAG: hypothetical protein LC725_10425, partial [Lentisphaerae bacterium]|nr:hypothetical protein [Lentisphaerota bacterium]
MRLFSTARFAAVILIASSALRVAAMDPAPPVCDPVSASNIVQAAYMDILGRMPDAEGWALYASRLMDGRHENWLREVLSASPEGRRRQKAIQQEARLKRRAFLLHWVLPSVWLMLLVGLCRTRIPDLLKKALILISALAGGLWAGWLILRHAALPPRYPDFIVGHITWLAATKLQDLLVVPAALLAFFMILLGGRKLANLTPAPSAQDSADREPAIIWYALPGAVTFIPALIASLFFNAPWRFDPLLLTISLVGIATLLFARLCHKNTPTIAWTMLAAILAISSVLVAASIVPGLMGWNSAISNWQMALILGTIMLTAGTGAATFSTPFKNNLPRLLVCSQMLLPLVFIAAMPQPLQGASMSQPLIMLHAIGWTAALLASGDLLRRWRQSSAKQIPSIGLLSPWCLLAVILFARGALNPVPPIILPDDYHFGESLLGWWTWHDFGYLPYVDFIPSHGMADNYLPGMLNHWWFDGAPGAMLETGRLTAVLMLTGLFFSIVYNTGHVAPATVVTLLLGSRTMLIGSRLGDFLLAILLFVYLAPHLRNSPRRWWFFWTFSAPLLFLAIPGQGLLFVAATLPTGI